MPADLSTRPLGGLKREVQSVLWTGVIFMTVEAKARAFYLIARDVLRHDRGILRMLRRTDPVPCVLRGRKPECFPPNQESVVMPLQVCNTALLKCSMAVPPGTSALVVTPEKMVNTSNQPAANIMDHIPMKNIMPFGMCQSPANPVVAAATTAALGVLTPMPCVPATPAPWVTGAPTVLIKNFPALDTPAILTCIWGGVITIQMEGQKTHQIP
jgi:hypothetical protein